MARYLITGGSGFIGQHLCRRWLSRGHQLWVLTRHPDRMKRRFPKAVQNQQLQAFKDWNALGTDQVFDAVINLAGEGIADRRWSAQRKKQLVESRVNTTRNLVKFLRSCKQKPPILISGSATGYYGNKGDFDVVEDTPPAKGFSWSLCERWEQMALQASTSETRVCIMRLGVVLGTGGGLFQRLKGLYRLGLGGPMGEGHHWLSWIHVNDVMGIIDFLIAQSSLSGVFNAVSPQPLRQSQFSAQLAAVFGKKDPLRVPEWVLKLFLGELAELLLSSQRSFPERLRGAGYEFNFRELGTALRDLVPGQLSPQSDAPEALPRQRSERP